MLLEPFALQPNNTTMASCIPPATAQRHHPHHHHRHRYVLQNSTTVCPPFFTSLSPFCSRTQFTPNDYTLSIDGHLQHSFLLSSSNPRTRSGLCHATSPDSPSPPKLDPPPGDNPDSSSGVMSRFSKVQDAVRIFFAVLFWMSLFFWSCVWDGKNDGRPNKGSRFRR